MADVKQLLEQLQGFDINDIDWDRIGVWPAPGRIFVALLVAAVIIAAAFYFVVKDKNSELERKQNEEISLREQFEKKAFEAANLDKYREQMVEMQESFGALVKQLPSSTEVPGLLDDIDEKGVESKLSITSITPQAEHTTEFYVELPIRIVVNGGFHEFGTFVSGVAGMPRIVTLHDFNIRASGQSVGNQLTMEILAKTYRYKAQGDES